MRYSNQMGALPKDNSNPGMLPSGATTTNMALTGPANPQAPIMSDPKMFNPSMANPGIKPSGAPVNFSPKMQSTMTSVFGMPTDGSYDRVMTPTI